MECESRPGPDSLCECRATLHLSHRQRPGRRSLIQAIVIFVAMAATMLVLVRCQMAESDVDSYCLAFPAVALPLALYLCRRVLLPAERGRLFLYPRTLVFQSSRAEPQLNIRLSDIEFASRRRNQIQLGMEGSHSFVEFSCSRLLGEDMFDQLLAQCDELGVVVKSFEHQA